MTRVTPSKYLYANMLNVKSLLLKARFNKKRQLGAVQGYLDNLTTTPAILSSSSSWYHLENIHVLSSAVICLKGCSCLAVCLCFRGTSVPPEGERLYRCSYDFLARNHTELSVLQGETLEVQKKWSILSSRHTAATNVIPACSPLQVLESSDRWSKCRNRFEEIGCVPSNILEPLSALNTAESSVVYREVPTRLTAPRPCMHSGFWLTPPPLSYQQKTSNPPRARFFSYAPSSPIGTSSPPISPVRPQSMVLSSTLQGEDGDRGNTSSTAL